MNGIGKQFYENGNKKWEISYVKNKENRVGKEFYEDGKIKQIATYIDGSLVSTEKYDEEGNEIK